MRLPRPRPDCRPRHQSSRLILSRAVAAPAQRRSDRVEGGAYACVVPDVPVVAPLELGVDADRVHLDPFAYAEVGGQVLQGLAPHLVLHLVAAHAESQLVEGIVGAHQNLGLGDGSTLFLEGTEGDPTRERVSLRRHQGEGLVIGVQDHHARRELDAAWQRAGNEGYLAWRDAGQRRVEEIPLGPEVLVIRFPGLDDLDGRNVGSREANPVGLLPHLPEALQRTYGPASLAVDVRPALAHASALERLGVPGPVGSVVGLWLVLLLLSRLILRGLLGHRVPPFSGRSSTRLYAEFAALTASSSESWMAMASSRRVIWKMLL